MSQSATEARLRQWTYRGLEICYYPELDGGGMILAAPFIEFVRQRLAGPGTVGEICEWCSGPGFIGFALLAEGLCERLCLCDINPRAIACVARTVEENGLHDRVRYYVSDNFDAIPSGKRFDLIVANPPNFFAINPEHMLSQYFRNDLRAHDPGWKIHRAFYAQVKGYLNRGARLYISEVEPHDAIAYVPHDVRVPYDIRPRPPLEDFQQMIRAGGLTYVETVPYTTMEGGVEMSMVVSKV